MIGIKEIGIGIALIALVLLFGRKTIIKGAKDFFGLKKELKDISEGKDVKVE